jgi:WhiB family redox-sensing transcriptional regulator
MLFIAGWVSSHSAVDSEAETFHGTREVLSERWQIQTRVEEACMSELLEMDDDGALGWQERALCAQTDPEAFFPEKGGSTREAKKVCLSCDVRGECLEYALSNDERFGIWGGLSERERRKLKKRA